MQKGHFLQFSCTGCENPIQFSIFDLKKTQEKLCCSECRLIYDFSDEKLNAQLHQFEALCRQIQLSEGILSQASVGIYVGHQEIKIPYKLLLTRLNSTLELFFNERPLTITFRIEPSLDVPLLC